jgi:methylated-DNA-[protein]-cysteine S-methyltransferase
MEFLFVKNLSKKIMYDYKKINSPVGLLTLMATDDKLVALLWASDRPNEAKLPLAKRNESHPILLETERQLEDYFAGTRTAFSIPLQFHGTEFQIQVWRALMDIPYGETCSYGRLAMKVGKPTASRAVGAANGRNPISIIVPCHRVIGNNGTLTGYGGGIQAKAKLLALEKSREPNLFNQ